MDIPGFKRCRRCDLILPDDDYPVSKRNPNIRNPTCKACNKLHHRYKLSWAEVKKARRQRACEACGSNEKLTLDHNHETGKFRGVLCNSCNLALGIVRESPKALRGLARYIVKNNV